MPEPKEFILGLMKMMAAQDFDAASFGESETFAKIVENQALMNTYRQEDAPEVLSYWEEQGLIKQLHDTEAIYTKWASYLPKSYVDDPTCGRTYPLLFVMHGSGNPIYLAETYGYTSIAAREELIVIIPEDETPENIDKLFAYAREHYPVDWTRVYMVGYSLGGFMTSRHAMRWPERFAAVGSGGMLFANGPSTPHVQAGKVWPGENTTPEMVRRAAHYKIPACTCMGEQEVLGLLPVTQDEPVNQWAEHLSEEEKKRTEGRSEPRQEDRIDLSGRNKIQSINNWRIANGCTSVNEAAVRKAAASTANIVEEKIGFPFEKTSVITRENRSHFVGDSVSEDGETYFRTIALAKSPHWPSQALAELTWEFISQFAVDPETGISYKIKGRPPKGSGFVMPVFQEAIVSQEIFDAARGIHFGRRRENLRYPRPGIRLRPGGQCGVWDHMSRTPDGTSHHRGSAFCV